MAAGNFTLYSSAKVRLMTGATIDLDSTALRAKLYKGAAAGSVSVVAGVSLLSEIGSNAAANCSIKTLSSCTFAKLSAGAVTSKFDCADLVITATGGNISSAKYLVLFQSASAGGGPLLAWCKLSTTAFSVTETNTLTITMPLAGLFVVY
jgi:hypothetical protein